MKTLQNGYFKLNTETGAKWIHFSMNCWFELQKDTGKSIQDIFAAWDSNITEEEAEKLSPDDLEALLRGVSEGRANMLADIAFAGLKAYDLEEGNDVDYNKYKVMNWISELGEDAGAPFWEALNYTSRIAELRGAKKDKRK